MNAKDTVMSDGHMEGLLRGMPFHPSREAGWLRFAKRCSLAQAEITFTLIREEIERHLLTDKENSEVLDYATPHLKPDDRIIASLNDFKGVAQAQLDKILKALEAK